MSTHEARRTADRAVKTAVKRRGSVPPSERGHGAAPVPGAPVGERPIQPQPEAAPSGEGRKAATQDRILDAAVTLFGKRGFERTSITAIAARAGVSRAAVFWHFGDKQHLFQEACRRLLMPFAEQLEKSLAEDDPRRRLFALFAVYEDFVAENHPTIETVVRWVLESPALRATLVQPLLSLHDAFARDVRETLNGLHGDAEEAGLLAAGLVSLLDGNLLLSLLDSTPASQARRRAGLRLLTEAVLDRMQPPRSKRGD